MDVYKRLWKNLKLVLCNEATSCHYELEADTILKVIYIMNDLEEEALKTMLLDKEKDRSE